MRTEIDKTIQTPIVAILGGKEYQIQILKIEKAIPWRDKFGKWYSKIVRELPQYSQVTTETPDKFEEVMTYIMANMPTEIIGLVLDYAPELNPDEIKSTATLDEFLEVFAQILEVEIPFVRKFQKMIERVTSLLQ